jgi:hypothetical protein
VFTHRIRLDLITLNIFGDAANYETSHYAIFSITLELPLP